MTSVKMAVVGGGVSGLTFARVMQKQGHDVVIFEREPWRHSRTQGGILDLHVESGQWALSQAGLMSEFQAMILEGAQDTRIVDKTGALLWDEVGPPGDTGRPEIDRPALRALLLDSLQSDTVQWGHHLMAIQPSGSQGHSLHFANGTTVTADIVIGADGARSRVRPLVTDAQPTYSGVSWFELRIPEVDRLHPEVAKFVGHGSFFALGDDKGILGQRNGDGSIRAYATFRSPDGSFPDMKEALSDAAASRKAVASLFQGWAPKILNIIHACDDILTLRPLMVLPVGVKWPSKPGVALLGDAAHLMVPFGEGANQAMQDGAELALKLAQYSDANEAIAAYEKKMFERTKAAAEDSAQALEMCISPNGAQQLAEFLSQAGS